MIDIWEFFYTGPELSVSGSRSAGMRVVCSVSYRHIAGYLKVVGPTQKGALQNAKRVGTRLLDLLSESLIRPPRLKEKSDRMFVYEVPVLLGEKPQEVKRILAQLVLVGSV